MATDGGRFSRNAELSLRLQGIGLSFLAARALTTAFDHGVFAALLESPMTPDALAGRLKLSPEPLRRTLRLLACLGVLAPEGDAFGLSLDFRPLCDPKSDEHLVPVMEHLHRLYKAWGEEFEGWLATGTVREEAFWTETEAEHARGQWSASVSLAKALAAQVDLSGKTHLLDVGSSAGHYSVSFLAANPQLRATLVDLENGALALAQQRLAERGLDGRARLLAGDYNQVLRTVADADAILYANVFSQEKTERRRSLAKLAAQALPVGGILVICETGEGGADPLFARLLAIHLRDFGAVIGPEQLKPLLAGAGFGLRRHGWIGPNKYYLTAAKEQSL